ncbi:MAG: Holliday junction resolvase RuvX [Alphaproteobacteria bacterium]|nr:Holliday junction resolvase RuvX [Alphaproteobacteria bacterium]
MLMDKIADLRAGVAPGRRLLGLDLGRKTIGLGLSDVTWTVASPLGTIARRRLAEDLADLLAEVDRQQAGGLVVGLPIGLDGREGPRCQSVRQFVRDLLKLRDLPVAFFDERLSTAAVERMLVDEVDMSRRRRRQVVDKLAAAYILQGALDLLRRPAG